MAMYLLRAFNDGEAQFLSGLEGAQCIYALLALNYMWTSTLRLSRLSQKAVTHNTVAVVRVAPRAPRRSWSSEMPEKCILRMV